MSSQTSKCPSIHLWSQAPCIREEGHDGYCQSKAQLNVDSLARAHWSSKNGKFISHHWYETIPAPNLRREGTCPR